MEIEKSDKSVFLSEKRARTNGTELKNERQESRAARREAIGSIGGCGANVPSCFLHEDG